MKESNMTINASELNIEVVSINKANIEAEVTGYTYQVLHVNGTIRRRVVRDKVGKLLNPWTTRQAANKAVKTFRKHCEARQAQGTRQWLPYQDQNGIDMWTIIENIDQTTCGF